MTHMSCLFGNIGQGADVARGLGEHGRSAGHNPVVLSPRRLTSDEATDEPAHDWYLRQWMKERGKKQADMSRELGWERGRVSKVYNGKVPYNRAYVAQLAAWLGIAPFELLMLPKEALHLRRIREAARAILSGD